MKVAIIGGGSYAWAFGFTRQFVKSDLLSDIELVLMDIDSERLADLKRAGDIFNKANGSPIKLKSTTNLDEALDGASYVIVSISTGGFDAMQHDLAIPEKYGIYHTVGDTVGPGGCLRGVRNIPVFDDFGARMKKLCPDAWMINVTNPLSPLTRTPQRNHGIKTVGMCPSVHCAARSLALMAGANLDARVDLYCNRNRPRFMVY
jgi:alpha-galactosidase/6-phospho-beta-glucosidase family protein